MENISNKVAFITGGGSGLGFAMAKSLSEAGIKVMIADIEERALEAAKNFFSEKKLEVETTLVDVTDRNSLEKAATKTEEIFGNIHILCNNAGVGINGNIRNLTYQDWDWVMGVNLNGVINGIQTFTKRIIRHGEGGHIVNTSSMAGLIGIKGLSIYNTAKYAVVGMSESLVQDLKTHNIGVSVLCPGFVNTRIYASERNRPSSLNQEVPKKDNPDKMKKKGDQQAISDEVLQNVIEPEIIGEMVLEAIKKNKFWILSHPEFKNLLTYRTEIISQSFDAWREFLTRSDKDG
ncbi:MAG: short-chain dehydrogenase [Gammaproteobacteria bacterium]|nr:short-chain dehydrogenase [Gammaproteobacteria bacterium]|tara:strand:- start:111 stop:983 length:873 start_codon:yes stop_codon:yes gene_type:complete